jgi:hypothetical protein
MLQEHKDQVKWLRNKGWGYKRIANFLDLKRDEVRNYCRKSGLTGYAADIESNSEKVADELIVYKLCLYCGSKLKQEGRGRKRKYCNPDCKREWQKKNRKQHIFKCEYCGRYYKTTRATGSKYCSNECYVRDRFYRKEDAKEVVDKILANKKVEYLPKWLKELLFSEE